MSADLTGEAGRAERNRWRLAQRLMNAAKVAMRRVQVHRRRVVLQRLAECGGDRRRGRQVKAVPTALSVP